jgi:16S rRNA (guanine527-N7)-methyltransferase
VSFFAERLASILGTDVSLTTEQLQQLEEHFELLGRWNRKINLTAVRDREEAVERHYAESVFFTCVLRQHFSQSTSARGLTVADVGSGAGFPGFVIAVMEPSWTVTLIESHRRKAVFLAEAGRLRANVRVTAGRAELLKESFDLIVSRAVRPEDVVPLMPRLAPNAALLVSAMQAGQVPHGNVQWQDPVPLPWAPTRVVLLGRST